MSGASPRPWMVSLHGGHSGGYCDHARDTLREVVEAAIAAGMHTFGITEHAPRLDPVLLYPEEIALGWNIPKINELFQAYALESMALIREYHGRIVLLRGFEAEVVPCGNYASVMRGFREEHGFDYVVGSVHYVQGIMVDYDTAQYQRACDTFGGQEAMVAAYYDQVAEMTEALCPEVIGHLDVVRKYSGDEASVSTPAIQEAAFRCLDVIADHGAILDINTAGYRKNIGRPYVAPWLVRAAAERKIGLCFGDDSHGVSDVGAGIPEARQYLLDLGVDTITTLTREGTAIGKRRVPLI